MYNAKVMEIFKNPKNVGTLKGANGIGKVGNAACGDIMKIYLKINDNGIIEDAKFKTFGCAAAITTTSVATEMIKGKTIEEALKLKNSEIIEYLGGLPQVKIHCSILAEEAIKAAVEDYYKRKAKADKNAEIEETDEDDDL
ncbi:MAG: iron-sulfur cluster assembly scaffold protein [Clostridia bacterium]|nr:iron-sulfur cluster assembly scaffold protein [Clostridia bacterium]